MPGNVAYCAAKGGVRMLTRTAGVELAPHGITVVGVAPGAVHTPIDEVTLADPVARAKLESAIPLGRVAEPEEIANSSRSSRPTAPRTAPRRPTSSTAG